MAVQNQTPNMDQFEAYFRRADLDQDGRISGPEAVAFFKGSNLPQPVLAQIWTYADQSRSGFLGRQEFYNALKLVTVAQKRELTPEIVKAALFTPASAKIPPPQINLTAIPGPLPANKVGADVPPKQVQTSVVGGPQGLPVQQSHFMRPPRPSNPSPGFQSQQIVSGQVAVGSRAPAPSPQQSHQVATSSVQPGLSKSNEGLDGKVPVTGNGFTSDPLFGDVFSVASVQPKQNLAPTVSSASGSVAVSSAADPLKTSSVNSQTTLHQQPVHHRPNQQIPVQNSVANPRNSLPGQSQLTWPRMTQSDYQKYSKVFMAVDTDRDGKISGAEARNLFLSWKLPREVLKQVWDLSDQDNDSMLSLREFCVALYLMERHREGRPLPSVLPANLIFDESLSPASGQPTVSHGATAWRHTPGPQQTQGQGPRGARQVAPGAPGRPPRPVPIPQPDEDVQPTKQKPKVPVLEKHLVDQLSTEEQGALNTKFQEATDAEKKVMELEKEILEAKEKIQFYHAKMQEIILYKSRCDNRLNEISERTSADKREVELLAKKYEEKYKQTGDVASKLTIEEATFRDIQDKKMELYRTIVKLDQDGNSDGIQDRANQIQADLEGLVKSLNDRCKTYGLRAKPTTLLELPFGWQPGIQEGAADWDGEWDKFDNEEFTFVKELTLDVENVIVPSKPKSLLVREKASTSLNDHDTRKSSAEADAAKLSSPVKSADTETAHAPRSPTDSPTRSNNAVESPSKEFEEARNRKDATFDGSPHAAHSEHWGTESVFSGDKNFDESDWPSFDTPLDADAAWDLNSASKDSRNEEHNGTYLFGDDDWNLRPIKTGPTNSSSMLLKQTPLFDSVPSTPSYPSGFSYSDNNQLPKQSSFFDSSVPSTPSYNSGFGYSDNNQFPKQTSFFDSSVPSTPSYTSGFGYSDNNQFPKQSSFFDSSVPSTPAYNAGGESPAFQNKSPFAFADSVPSTPMSGNNFSRFDSFNMPDSGGPFGSHEFSRFDSMRSTRDSEYDSGGGRDSSFARFDSFRSTADSDYNFGLPPPRETLSRFDSMRSTTDYGHGFSSFDDADPLGSHDPFKTSTENRTPKKDSDNWKAF